MGALPGDLSDGCFRLSIGDGLAGIASPGFFPLPGASNPA